MYEEALTEGTLRRGLLVAVCLWLVVFFFFAIVEYFKIIPTEVKQVKVIEDFFLKIKPPDPKRSSPEYSKSIAAYYNTMWKTMLFCIVLPIAFYLPYLLCRLLRCSKKRDKKGNIEIGKLTKTEYVFIVPFMVTRLTAIVSVAICMFTYMLLAILK